MQLVERGGPRALGDGVALAVHRVVQESLTNALTHAPSRPTTATVDYATTAVDVRVTTGPPPAHPAGSPAPRAAVEAGLAGLRERVTVLGGHLQAGPRPDGSFSVHARIPVRQQ